MTRIGLALALGLLASACGERQASEPTPTSSSAPEPDTSQCSNITGLGEGNAGRTSEIEIPAEHANVAVVDGDVLGVSAEEGTTICADLSWIHKFESTDSFGNERFFGVEWWGHETFGYFLFDRSAEGMMVDTGAKPVLSPSGERLAAAQISEAGWGGMEGIQIWDVAARPMRSLSAQIAGDDGVRPAAFEIEASNWVFERWVGEECIELSAMPWNGGERLELFASEGNDWLPETGTCPN